MSYVNGDPDLPVITGSAVNAFNLPPFQLPQNQALAGYRKHDRGTQPEYWYPPYASTVSSTGMAASFPIRRPSASSTTIRAATL